MVKLAPETVVGADVVTAWCPLSPRPQLCVTDTISALLKLTPEMEVLCLDAVLRQDAPVSVVRMVKLAKEKVACASMPSATAWCPVSSTSSVERAERAMG